MMGKTATLGVLLAALMFAGWPGKAGAQGYPTKTITIVVPAAAGGGIDLSARWLAAELTPALGKNVVVENRGGGSGIPGSQQVARAEPDGHTILVTLSGFLVTSPALFNSLPWDPLKDFAPVSMLWTSPHVLVVNKDSPIKSLSELIAYGRDNPGKLTYGSPGITSETHLGSEMFAQLAKIKVTPVPYRGTGPAFNDVLAGQLGFFLNTMQQLMGPVQAGTVRGLALANATRHPQLPNIPTAAEAGLPGLEVDSWYGVYAPSGTPRDIVERIAAEIKKICERADFRERVDKSGVTMSYRAPDDFAKYTAAQVARWNETIPKLGIPKQN
jgi:tripartite-type tricarboxylate transporter receptor subunit TctC